MIDENISLSKLRPIFIEISKQLTGVSKRAFQASITVNFLNSSPRKAEAYFGWSRDAVFTGIRELETGIKCIDNFSAKGNKKTETKLSTFEEDIRSITAPKSQVDPKFQSPFAYTRITAKGVHKALIEHKGYTEEELPTLRTISNILNRLGYKLRRIQKTKPKKK